MVVIKNDREIAIMREAGKISQKALRLAGSAVKAGVSTYELDKIVHDYIVSMGATPSFLGYGGFPASSCISVNDVVVHGIPSKNEILKNGDVVSIDVGAHFKGFHADNAWTFACGEVSDEVKLLMKTTEESLFLAIEQAVVGNRIGDIGSTVQEYTEARSYSVVRDLIGHGVGAKLHEDPSVPNYGTKGRGMRLTGGMTLAIEPMINLGTYQVETMEDGWTVRTKDRKISVHYEHSIAITQGKPYILTELD